MVTEIMEGYGIQGITIQLNASEMQSITRLNKRAVQVVKSQLPDSPKKEYFTGEDAKDVVRLTHAILRNWNCKMENDIDNCDISELLKVNEEKSSNIND
jgi:hypothetical protein